MGYSIKKHWGGEITSFWPDDTETELYISAGASLSVIIEVCKDKWPNADFSEIEITAEHIHTDCLYYDSYCSVDYTDFIKIEYFKG